MERVESNKDTIEAVVIKKNIRSMLHIGSCGTGVYGDDDHRRLLVAKIAWDGDIFIDKCSCAMLAIYTKAEFISLVRLIEITF